MQVHNYKADKLKSTVIDNLLEYCVIPILYKGGGLASISISLSFVSL